MDATAHVPPDAEERLRDVRRAFDSVAAGYDGPAGNNAVIRRLRSEMWRTLTDRFPPGSRLLDIGCGTGIDAVYLAERGYSVLAVDWSPAMVERTRGRIAGAGVGDRAGVRVLGVQDLAQLRGERFDGIYSDLGPFNCALDLEQTARNCAALLAPGGSLVVSVIGRICPWELAYYAARRDRRRALVRWARAPVPVPLNGETVWTCYYTPRQFFRAFAARFELVSYRGLCLFSPPPYLDRVWKRFPSACAAAQWADRRLGGWPILRNGGDHFLMVMTRRA